MMNEKELNKKMNDLSINARRVIIENIGLSKLNKEILVAKYIDEMSINEMCNKFCYDRKNVEFKISKAKKELNRIIEREYKIMDDKLKEYIKLIIEDK